MREIIGNIYSHLSLDRLSEAQNASGVALSAPRFVESYREMARCIAVLAQKNRGFYLLYRGQDEDYQTNSAKPRTNIAPSIFRPQKGRKLDTRLKQQRIEALKDGQKALLKLDFEDTSYNKSYLKHYEVLAWALFQHYHVMPTPLLDVTASLHTACSIAAHSWKENRKKQEQKHAALYVLGFDETTLNMSFSFNSGLQLIRLLSVMPETALRPLYQEGFLTGAFPQDDIFAKTTQHNFAVRLIAKFSFDPEHFWQKPFQAIPKDILFPKDDPMGRILKPLCTEYESLW
ncbi:MAG: FRG domain-containing protein [Spirochaetaceae bacterium]|jgi:hypothetical protein|nr:FRG domain-containing protein [Spirochaetaceae bacterium]